MPRSESRDVSNRDRARGTHLISYRAPQAVAPGAPDAGPREAGVARSRCVSRAITPAVSPRDAAAQRRSRAGAARDAASPTPQPRRRRSRARAPRRRWKASSATLPAMPRTPPAVLRVAGRRASGTGRPTPPDRPAVTVRRATAACAATTRGCRAGGGRRRLKPGERATPQTCDAVLCVSYADLTQQVHGVRSPWTCCHLFAGG